MALVGSVIVIVIALASYVDLSYRLAEKSELLDQQELHILEYGKTIDAQSAEINAKAAELAQVKNRINLLSQELADSEQKLQQESDNAAILEREMDALNEQASILQVEIVALQSKIQADEQRIEDLSRLNLGSTKTTVSHYGLGVDQNNQGMVFPIRVEIIHSGSGILSVDINNVQYEQGFQTAVRAAATVASQYSGEGISDKDIIVRFAPDGSRFGDSLVKVDGSSAGAIIAAMIVAGLSDSEINSSILVTGSVNEDGTIGRIGSLQEKLVAADAFDAEAMLVPASQEFESDTIPVIGVSDIHELMERLRAS